MTECSQASYCGLRASGGLGPRLPRRGGIAVLVAALVILSASVSPIQAQDGVYHEALTGLRHPDARVRLRALRTIREAGHVSAAGPAAALLADPLDDVQLEAINTIASLFLMHRGPTRTRVALVVEVRQQRNTIAAFHGGQLAVLPHPVPPEVLSGLVQASRSMNARIRVEALYAFGALGRPPVQGAAVQHLLALLRHPDPATRTAAIQVLGRLRVLSAGEALVHAINDAWEPARVAAMRAVGELREERALMALGEQLEYYGRGRVAEAALDGIARIAHPTSVWVFRSYLNSSSPELRRIAAEGLARTADQSMADELETSIGAERSDAVRLAIAFALHRMNRPYLPRIVEAVGNPRLRDQAMTYLLELEPPSVAAIAESPTSSAALHPYLQDPDPSIRASVAEVLGFVGGSPALDLLEPLRRDASPEVVTAAERAVARIQLGL